MNVYARVRWVPEAERLGRRYAAEHAASANSTLDCVGQLWRAIDTTPKAHDAADFDQLIETSPRNQRQELVSPVESAGVEQMHTPDSVRARRARVRNLSTRA
ncbi:MAG: hypothetical protein C0444_00120 [Microbacterium sp.]|nr:hypothetical protein [Microbacterium sp.]MBA4346160.1 hypothetical protein [Microbacterium sp.]